MRDGGELRKSIQKYNSCGENEKQLSLNDIVKPYIQFVENNTICQQTGLMLSDIWRYFRHTWINEYKSLPGRSISILIRDAAVTNHPVIGIAALGSSVAQQSCRDQWIGWEGATFLNSIMANPSKKDAIWLKKSLDNLLSEIYLKDFIKNNDISIKDIQNPSDEVIKKLREMGKLHKTKHIDFSQTAKFITSNDLNWEERALTIYLKVSEHIFLLSC